MIQDLILTKQQIRTYSLILGEENKIKLKEDLEALEIQKG
jgi:hypothetical protein